MKKTKTVIYYSIIFGVVLAKMLFTVYEESLIILQGNRQSELAQARQELEYQQLQLTQQLSQTNSYLTLEDSGALDDYVTISQPLSVDTTEQVAASEL